MRSIYAKILVWCLGTILLSLAAFGVLSQSLSSRQNRHFFENLNAFQLTQAVAAFESGGSVKLSGLLTEMNHSFHARHYLTDASGVDLVSREDKSQLFGTPSDPHVSHRRLPDGKAAFSSISADGRYRFVVVAPPPPFTPLGLVPYYAPILLAVALLCWAFAMTIATPLREFAGVVTRFGHGDLSARVRSSRRDEIGELALAFDKMADAIETLRYAEKQLLQDISHELRSPLARLSFAAELTKTASDRDGAARRVKKEIGRLTDLVGGILELTRSEGDPSSRDWRMLSLTDLLHEVVRDCELEAHAQDRQLIIVRADTAELYGGRELLRRAIENVLRNAIRYAPAGSAVEVALASGSEAELVIRDYGSGVPDDSLGSLFKPFFRADESRNSSTGGVGLGLAIAHRAIALHRGEMSAVNANPGLLVRMKIRLSAAPVIGPTSRSDSE